MAHSLTDTVIGLRFVDVLSERMFLFAVISTVLQPVLASFMWNEFLNWWRAHAITKLRAAGIAATKVATVRWS